MVLPATAVGPLVGPFQGVSVRSARLTAAWALVWAAGQPLGPEVECAGPLDEPRSQPASTKTATTRAVAVDRALRTVGVLRLRCTEAPCGGCRPGTLAVPAAWVMEGCPACRRPVSRRANRGRRPRRCAVGDERSSRPV